MKKIIYISVLFVAFSFQSQAQKVKDATYYYQAAMKESDLNKVIANFTKAINLSPKYADAIFYRGVAYFHNNNPQKALADFNQIIQMDAKSFAAFTYRGRTYERLNNKAAAINDFNAALKINPKYAEGLNFRGLYYKNNGEAQKACADLKQAKKMGFAVADADLAGCVMDEKKLDKGKK